MIISSEQVRRAVEYLQTPECGSSPSAGCEMPHDISPELLEKIRASLEHTPDLRDDRVAQGRAMLDDSSIGSVDVAEKMIGRIISDSIR